MNKEDIKTINAYISLNPGDCIIDSLGKIEEVAYIDYVAKMVVAIAVARESLIGDLSFRSRATIITFDDIICHYQKVLIPADSIEPHSCVKEVKDNNSPKIGDEITGAEGNKYVVVCIDYNDCEVTVRSTDGEEITFNLDGFDSSVYKKVLK